VLDATRKRYFPQNGSVFRGYRFLNQYFPFRDYIVDRITIAANADIEKITLRSVFTQRYVLAQLYLDVISHFYLSNGRQLV